MQEVTIRRPDDFHVHVRDGDMMRTVVPWTARHFARALVMPNVPAIHTGDEATAYRRRIEDADGAGCEWLMTIKLTHRTTPEMIREATRAGVVAAKLYPEGATTASHDGIRDPWVLRDVYAAIQDEGMVLCVHGEEPSAFVLDREGAYLGIVKLIARDYPRLRVVMEHITTQESVDAVWSGPANLAATITAHHLIHTLDDVIGSGLRPHHFCYPVPKRPSDRRALIEAARHGERFFFGSDTAPHRRGAKESACGCAGVFSAPVALSVLTDVFLGGDAAPATVDRLQAFTSERGADFYGLPRNEGAIRLARRPWTVPEAYGDVIPLWAGKEAAWQVMEPATR